MKALRVIKSILLLICAGAILCLAGCSENITTDIKQIDGDFGFIEIDTDTADVFFLPSEGGVCKVVTEAPEGITHTAELVGDTLKIEAQDTRIAPKKLFAPRVKLTVYLPKYEYGGITVESDTGDVKITNPFKLERVTLDTDTGNIEVCGVSVETLSAEVNTGNVYFENVTASGKISACADTGNITVKSCHAGGVFADTDTGNIKLTGIRSSTLKVDGETGDITLSDVIIESSLDIVSDTGDVRFTDCDAADAVITTDTGDVTGNFLTDKIIFAHSDTGKVNITKMTVGGRCDITSDTGDINITIP